MCSKSLFFALLLAISCLPGWTQVVPPPAREGAAKADDAKTTGGAGSKVDPFDFSDKNSADSALSGKEQYIKLDESIKVQVDPVQHGAVVDRIFESATIYVVAPGRVRVEVFLEPVDSPYCGKSLAEPRLLGCSSDQRRNFPVIWSNLEAHHYVKIYARAYKPGVAAFGRSRSVDLAIVGQRLQNSVLK
jgi:hypothetical protein